jgi:photosystem I subunit 2
MSTTNYFPEFGGSTGGWLQAAETEEKYVMTWTNEKKGGSVEQNTFEMPTGGAAIMRKGENLLYLARKEQCLALATQVKTSFKITDYKIYRIFPSGEVQYLHPKDGVFPEKVNAGRVGVGNVSHSIGKNLNPAQVKFTNKSIN